MAILIFRFALSPDFMPTHPDETLYYSGAKVFAEINSVKARSTIFENVSAVLEADWYGIFYPIVYGLGMKVIGVSGKAYIMINIFFYILIVVSLLNAKVLESKERIALIAITLASPVLMVFSFYFMPLLLNMFFAFILLLALLRVAKSVEKDKPEEFKKRIIIFLSFTLLFSLFRVTFIFWVLGILPFAAYRKKKFQFYAICAVLIGIIIIYMKFFNAPSHMSNIGMTKYLLKLDIYSFLSEAKKSVVKNFFSGLLNFQDVPKAFIIPYYFTLFAPFYFVFRYYKKNNSLLLGVSLICLVSNMVSTFLYYLRCYYFMRLSVPLFVALCFIVAMDKTIPGLYRQIFIGLLLISSGITVAKSWPEFEDRKQVAANLKNDFYLSINEIQNKIADQPVTTILASRDFFEVYPEVEFEMAVPYVTPSRKMIRYTYNMAGDDLQMHNKLKIDYVLSPDSLNRQNLSHIYSNQYYYLYKIK